MNPPPRPHPTEELVPEAGDDRLFAVMNRYWETVRTGGATTPEAWQAAHPEAREQLAELRVVAALYDVCRLVRADSACPTDEPPTHPSVEPANTTPPPEPTAGKESGCDFLAPPQAADEIGRLGPYRVLRVLGTGGMGIVFEAEEVLLKRRVALKAMKPALAASDSARRRFLREAQTAAAIEHDHIIHINHVAEDRGVPFLAMPLLKGLSLEDWLKRGNKPTTAQVLRLGRQIAEGLAAAHERGLIHRDVKPSNVWIEPDHGGRVKLLDFGLARAVDDDAHLTQTGAIVGTPAYMAPEQGRGETVDARCDLFSLGAVLYRMTTGQLPFHAKDSLSMLLAVATDQPKPPIALNPAVPPALSELVMRLLS